MKSRPCEITCNSCSAHTYSYLQAKGVAVFAQSRQQLLTSDQWKKKRISRHSCLNNISTCAGSTFSSLTAILQLSPVTANVRCTFHYASNPCKDDSYGGKKKKKLNCNMLIWHILFVDYTFKNAMKL